MAPTNAPAIWATRHGANLAKWPVETAKPTNLGSGIYCNRIRDLLYCRIRDLLYCRLARFLLTIRWLVFGNRDGKLSAVLVGVDHPACLKVGWRQRQLLESKGLSGAK